MRQQPAKIDLGAVYAQRPHNSGIKIALEKEVVFDIDMTDYDLVRTCCSGTEVCNRCWRFITIAIKIIDMSLREDFAFEAITWVFSGRRGVHCWVRDERARCMTDEQRGAIVEQLQPVSSKNRSFTEHPSFARFTEGVVGAFAYFLEEQDPLRHAAPIEFFCKLMTASAALRFQTYITGNPENSSVERWAFIGTLLQEESPRWQTVQLEMMFRYVYPRLDANVTKQMKHLLKAPWTAHPTTGKICIPIAADTCETFDPQAVPTVEMLAAELAQQSDDMMESSLTEYIIAWEEMLMQHTVTS